MMKAAVVVLLLVAATPAFATVYTVGDSKGWTTTEDYSTWISGKTFKTGDSLLFQYTSLHTVLEVTKDAYEKCNTGNSINTNSDGNTTINLTSAGTRYFICGTPGHCSNGMKLSVTVAAGGGGSGTPPSSPTPPGSPPANTPPSPTSSQPPPSNPSPGSNGAAGRGGLQGAAAAAVLVALGLALLG